MPMQPNLRRHVGHRCSPPQVGSPAAEGAAPLPLARVSPGSQVLPWRRCSSALRLPGEVGYAPADSGNVDSPPVSSGDGGSAAAGFGCSSGELARSSPSPCDGPRWGRREVAQLACRSKGGRSAEGCLGQTERAHSVPGWRPEAGLVQGVWRRGHRLEAG